VSLIARHLEAHGISTLCVASALDITEAGRPPRATFLDYPLGHTAGKPFDVEDQYDVIRASVVGFERIAETGTIERLPNRWSSDDSWQQDDLATPGQDSRQPRDETPQFQSEDDRLLAISSGALTE
jgi:D-proline reductase (dithiol) PrdB